ncbi:two-component regulator propeller domain-containing protein [Winogradskyella maritima]|uniref:histidine kinase n=1 Tax=Winogradskyella maritima TaxID=1517766 RepID=A0ABV8AJ96_9FLAO|nr:two-component regulator propeller domain-containing protein [Winogradskyella maritima]
MRHHFLYLILLACSFGFAQTKFAHFTTSDGLPNSLCYGLTQDHLGYLWIGTDDGLSQFNGREFTNYRTNNGLKSNYAIVPFKLKNRLITSTWGSGLYVKNGTQFKRLAVNDSISKIDNLFFHKNFLWSVNNSKDYVYKPVNDTIYKQYVFALKLVNNFPVFKDNLGIHDVSHKFKSVNDELFLFGDVSKTNSLKGIFKIKDLKTIQPVFRFIDDNDITDISAFNKNYIISSKSKIFIASKTKILNKIQPRIINEIIDRVIPYNQNFLVISRDNKNIRLLRLIDNLGNILIDYNTQLNIISNVSDVLIDNENNIWISTYGQGLYCVYSPEKLQFTTIKNSNNKLITDIANVKNSNFLLTDSELLVANTQEVEKAFAVKNNPKTLSVFNDSLIVSAIGKGKKLDIPNAAIKEVNTTLSVFNTEVGLISIKEDVLKIPELNFEYKDRRFLYLLINDVDYINGKIYVATNDGLLTISETTNNSRIKSQINTLIKDKDTLWVGANSGLYKITNDSISHVKQKNNNLSQNINALLKDKDNNLWIGSSSGLTLLKGKEFKNLYLKNSTASSYIKTLNQSNDGKIWVGTNNGAFTIDNFETLQDEKPPLLVVKQKGRYSFYVDVIAFNRSEDFLLQFKINNKDWENTKSENFDFNDYTQGNYRLQFRAKKKDSSWAFSEVYNFEIRLPWYRQNYFYISLIILCFAGIIYFINRRLVITRKRNQRLSDVINKKNKLEAELNSVRENIARDFHDNFGNKLARISMISNYLIESKKSSNDEYTTDAFEKIKYDADDLYQGTKDFMFALKTNSDSVLEVINYLGDFGHDLMASYNIDFEIKSSLKKDVKLPYYWNRQIILIFKEALTNIAKHSHANKAFLKFEIEHQNLQITCKDNGEGFDINTNILSGINNMKKRAERIGANLKITSEPKNGVEIHFSGLIEK